jgi:two-component system NtrC family sensor kinase
VTAGVAHELNNRLTVVLGQAQLLRRVPALDPVAAKKIEKIEEEVLRASLMTRGLVDRTRVEPIKEGVAINTVVARALELARPLFASREIALEMDLSDPPPVIIGDAAQLTHLVLHLVSNAIEAMDREGTLTVNTILEDDAVELTVTDSGPGMTPEHASRIFEPFFTTKSVRGAGLGLFMTLTTLKTHGGTITVQTAPGRGTTMRVRLPRGSAGTPRLIVVK